MEKGLTIGYRAVPGGMAIEVEGKEYAISFPREIWDSFPDPARTVLCENLCFADTHFLPLMLEKQKIEYRIPLPLLEPFFFKNQLYDLTGCEKSDERPPSSYVKKFYNLEVEYAPGESSWALWPPLQDQGAPKAIVPFTFGKESLASVALCRELGIEPIAVYCQEPAHPYEDEYKRAWLDEFGKRFSIRHHYIQNGPGLFRYGIAFGLNFPTEIGWGAQTTILSLMMLPFSWFYGARFIFFGNEVSCNESEWNEGWKTYLAGFDQTCDWVRQQNNMVRLLSGNQCSVRSTFEPLDEINIFYLLHHRYPDFSPYQFSCMAQEPLWADTQWCHSCYKCSRMFLFARACGFDPYRIGFKKDLLNLPGQFENYFGREFKSGSAQELDFAFYMLYKRKSPSLYLEKFVREKLPHLRPWEWYRDYYTRLKPILNLPPEYREKMVVLFSEEMASFRKMLEEIS